MLKDWKKLPKIKGTHSKYHWKNLKTQESIVIFPPQYTINKRWVVRYPSNDLYALSYTKDFLNEKQALKFAKEYMKRH